MFAYRLAGLFAATVLGAAACGGSSTEPKQDEPPPAIARVELATDRVLVFTGRTAALSQLVSRVADVNGAPVPASSLVFSVTAPAGWQVRGDTVTAPSGESVAELRISAAYKASASSAVASVLLAAIDVAAPTIDATAGIDLRAHSWRASWRCADTTGYPTGMTDAGLLIDSVQFDRVAFDSVVYQGDASWVPNYGGIAQVWWHGPVIRWLQNDTTDTVAVANHNEIVRQAPDSIVITPGFNNPETGVGEWPLVRVSAAATPLRYEGGTWCRSEWIGRRGAVTLEQVTSNP
jgi:hypothetical protein